MEIFLSPFDLIDIFTGYYFQPSSSQRRVHPLHGGTTTIRAKKNYFQGWHDSSRSKQEARWNCQGNIILTSSSLSGTNPSRLFEHQSNHFKDVCRVHTRNGTKDFFSSFFERWRHRLASVEQVELPRMMNGNLVSLLQHTQHEAIELIAILFFTSDVQHNSYASLAILLPSPLLFTW